MGGIIRIGVWCAAVLLAGLAWVAKAQTAGDIHRLNQAVQICNSPMGAGMAECAKLRGRPSGTQVGASGGATSNLLGALNAAMAPRAPAAAPAPAADPQVIAACVRAAGADSAAVQACLAPASAPRPTPVAGMPGLGQPLLPSAQRNLDTAAAIHQGAGAYQACAAANPTKWQACLPLLNGGQGAR